MHADKVNEARLVQASCSVSIGHRTSGLSAFMHACGVDGCAMRRQFARAAFVAEGHIPVANGVALYSMKYGLAAPDLIVSNAVYTAVPLASLADERTVVLFDTRGLAFGPAASALGPYASLPPLGPGPNVVG